PVAKARGLFGGGQQAIQGQGRGDGGGYSVGIAHGVNLAVIVGLSVAGQLRVGGAALVGERDVFAVVAEPVAGVGVEKEHLVHAVALDGNVDAFGPEFFFRLVQRRHGVEAVGEVVVAHGEVAGGQHMVEHAGVPLHRLDQLDHGVAFVGEGEIGHHVGVVGALNLHAPQLRKGA